MFFNNGLAPVSAAVAGWVIALSLEGTFFGVGGILVTLCIVGLLIPKVRRLGMSPT
jgi:hypothetical protein